MVVCNCSMFCCTLLYVHSSIAIILMGKSELVALLNLSSWCLVIVKLLFLAVPRGCLRFAIVVFPDHTHLLFLQTHHHIFALFLQTVHVIEKLLACFNVQPRNWYEPVVNLTALSRDAADDVKWVHTASSTFLLS